MDVKHILSQVMLAIIPLIGVATDVAVSRDYTDVGQGLFTLWLSDPCQGQDLLPRFWSRSPKNQVQ